MSANSTEKILDALTEPGELLVRLSGDSLVCTACGHRCKLHPGQRGVCKVRYNSNGTLQVPYRYISGIHNDPIEKKPFFHVLPGSMSMSFGMLGCDFHCAYCQNWFTSQSLRDEDATVSHIRMTGREICERAVNQGSRTVVSTYNEPLITSEWAVEVFREAKKRGLQTAYVSNGHATPEVLAYLRPWLDLFKIDLKCFDEKKYRRLGGNLGAILDSIRQVFEMGFWMEIVTLVIPDYNDSDPELADIAAFIASVSPDIPWHVTAFHPDYRMVDKGRTPVRTLLRARKHGEQAGLRYIYSGNIPGEASGTENTYCHKCRALLIERIGFRVVANNMKSGTCFSCQVAIPGRWDA